MIKVIYKLLKQYAKNIDLSNINPQKGHWFKMITFEQAKQVVLQAQRIMFEGGY